MGMLTSVALGAGMAGAEDAVGWITPLTTGNYYWNDADNWEHGVVNGVFGSNLSGSGKTYPTVLITGDVALTHGLNFSYTNSEQYLTFCGESSAHTLTLGDDILVALMGSTGKGQIAFGTTDSTKNLNLDLNGNRTFRLDTTGFCAYGAIYGGDLRVTGDAANNAHLTLSGNDGHIDAAAKVTFTTGRGLFITEKSLYLKGCPRAGDVRLESGYLMYEGTDKGEATEDSIARLTLAPGANGGGLVRFQNYGSSSYKAAHLSIGEIVREEETMLDVHTANSTLGAGVVGTAGSVNVTVDNGVAAVGSGTFGTPTAPVVPWARGSVVASQTTDQRYSSLVTYEPEKGFRLLDSETEYEAYTGGYTGSVVTAGANVCVIPDGVVDFRGNCTVNSILLSSTDTWKYLVATNGTLTVTSGAVDMSSGLDNLVLNANLDFGDRTGYITSYSQKRRYLEGTITGSAGVVYADQIIRSRNAGAPLAVSAQALYTGNAYINGYVAANSADAVPHGAGKGDFYVNGRFQPTVGGGVTVNGLYGRGKIDYANSYLSGFTFGGNDANGDFSGEISSTQTGKLPVTKIGAGCQRLGGDVSIAGSPFAINAGTLIVDGAVAASEVTVAENATLGGSGTFEPLVTLKDGAILEAGSKENGKFTVACNGGLAFHGDASLNLVCRDRETVGRVDVAGGVAFAEGRKVTVNILLDEGIKLRGGRTHVVLTSTQPLALASLRRGSGCGRLSLSEDNLQLLMCVSDGLCLVIR
ncbi:MAG: hypothetical protein ACI4R9_09275 [Kiritimatiellia bacterium]